MMRDLLPCWLVGHEPVGRCEVASDFILFPCYCRRCGVPLWRHSVRYHYGVVPRLTAYLRALRRRIAVFVDPEREDG